MALVVDTFLKPYLEQLIQQRMDQGGFADEPGGAYRPDATAWALFLLQHDDQYSVLLKPARDRLAKTQLKDGSIPIAQEHPKAVWPTPLAVLAWHGSSYHRTQHEQAIEFLLGRYGHHWTSNRQDEDFLLEHDPSIHGWPWVADTHSWVSPTALAMIALSVSGYKNHERVEEGVEMLLNRQLPHGGWNYGNTAVWGQELRPFPETTGMTLNALAGHVPPNMVERSLAYLVKELPTLQTPITLGWSLLGLAAWEMKPTLWKMLIKRCLDQQSRYGLYNTSSLSLLLSAGLASEGLDSLFSLHTDKTTSTLAS